MKSSIIILFFLFYGCWTTDSQTKDNLQFDTLKKSIKNDNSDSSLVTGWYYILDSAGIKRQLNNSTDIFFIDPTPILTVKDFSVLEIYKNNYDDKYGLKIQLNDKATKLWSIATGKSIGKKLAFILDDKLIYTPKVNSQIDFGVTALNRGDISKDELEKIKKKIEEEMK